MTKRNARLFPPQVQTGPSFVCVAVSHWTNYNKFDTWWEHWCDWCKKWHAYGAEPQVVVAKCRPRKKHQVVREPPWKVYPVEAPPKDWPLELLKCRPLCELANRKVFRDWRAGQFAQMAAEAPPPGGARVRTGYGRGRLPTPGKRSHRKPPGPPPLPAPAPIPPPTADAPVRDPEPVSAPPQDLSRYAVTVTAKDGTKSVLYQPTWKQLLFHQCGARNILYGGAVAGGKSTALRWDAHMACLSTPNIKVLILRRTFPELADTHIEYAMKEARTMGGEYLKSEYRLRFPNGSVEQYGHCGDDAAVSRYLSTEYERIYFDELVTFTFRQFMLIGSRARTTKPGYIPRVLAATNPGGPHATWVREWFIDKNVDRGEYPAYDPRDYAYVPATLDDNPYIDAAVYEHRLSLLPMALRQAYRHGSWDVFEGQYFKEWRASKHVRTYEDLPADAQRVRALDWGYLRPGVCLWGVMLPDGHLYLEDEYMFTETIASDVAQEIRRRSKVEGRKVSYTVADPAMWIREGLSGESIAETFTRHGVPLIKADNSRVVGWQRLRHWLAPAPDGIPWLTVHPRCAYLIRTLPSLLMDAHNPEDCDSSGEDHGADCARYMVQSRPHPKGASQSLRVKPGTAGALLAALRLPGKPRIGASNARRSA